MFLWIFVYKFKSLIHPELSDWCVVGIWLLILYMYRLDLCVLWNPVQSSWSHFSHIEAEESMGFCSTSDSESPIKVDCFLFFSFLLLGGREATAHIRMQSSRPLCVVSRGHREPPALLPCEHTCLTQLEELRKPTACRKVAVPPCLPWPFPSPWAFPHTSSRPQLHTDYCVRYQWPPQGCAVVG